jgi:hypothetical protein
MITPQPEKESSGKKTRVSRKGQDSLTKNYPSSQSMEGIGMIKKSPSMEIE